MKNILKFGGAGISLIVIAIFLALYHLKPFPMEKLDLALLDSLFRIRGPVAVDGSIAIVAIDKNSIHRMGRWPWPRPLIASLVDRVADAKPAVIVLDFLFADVSHAGPGADRKLAGAIEKAGNVIIPYLFYLSRFEAAHQSQESLDRGLASVRSSFYNQMIETGPPARRRRIFEAAGIEAPLPSIAGAAAASGFYNIVPEPDGSFRSIPLVIYAQETPCQSLAVSSVRKFLQRRDAAVRMRGGMVEAVLLGGRKIETDPRGCMTINFYGAPRVFPTISAGDLLDGMADASPLEGKIVLVGGTSLGDFETRTSPLAPVVYSVQVQANAVGNILREDYLRANYLSLCLSLLAIIAPSLFLGFSLPRLDKSSAALCSFLCCAALLLAGDYIAFTRAFLKISIIYGLSATACAYVLVSLYSFLLQERRGELRVLTLNAVTEAITSILDLDEILPRILTCVMHLTGAGRAALMLSDTVDGEKKLVVKSTINLPVELMSLEEFDSSRGLVLRAAEARESKIDMGGRRRGDDTGAMLCLPLLLRNRLLGVLYADGIRSGAPSPKKILPLLESFAAQASIAIDNARLHDYLMRGAKEGPGMDSVIAREIGREQRFPYIIGNSKAMQKVYTLIEKALDSDVTVLIEGETGTGKEVIARTIHFMGSRKDKPFVAQNCAALPEGLLESELFGHRRGAFTGAVTDKKGLFEIAHGGTIFLDEIGEMSLGTQAKILRVLENGVIRPLGGTKEKTVDCRIISATHRDLAREIENGKFREDLFYRFNVFPIRVPALRERRDDIPILAEHFLVMYRNKLSKEVRGIAPGAMNLIASYDFPGNVRELENEIERLVVLAPEEGMIAENLLSEKFRAAGEAEVQEFYAEQGMSLGDIIRATERRYIREVLRRCGGSKTKAAKSLGISRVTLHKKLREYDIN